MPIDTVEELKKKMARLLLVQSGPQSYARKFKIMEMEIDKLKKRVRRLEGTDSPDDGDSP